jgi:thiol-disulfide isomerase/thioredoxin
MKTKIRIVIYILTLAFIGCTPIDEKVDIPKRTVISGKILNLDVYPTTKEIFVEVFDFRDRKTVFKDYINEDGSFKIVFDLYAKQDIKMTPLLNRIILNPGDSIFIALDFSDISKVHFTGDRAESNKAFRKYLWSNAGTANFYSHEKIRPESYKLYCDSILVETSKILKEFIQKENPPDDIIQWTSDYLTINYFKSLLSYPRTYFKRDDEGYNDWFAKTISYFDFVDSIENNFANFGYEVINTDIYQLLDSYRDYLIQRLIGSDSANKGYSLNQLNSAIMNSHHNTIFRQMVLGNYYYKKLSGNYLTAFDDSKKLLDSIIQEPFLREPLFYFYNDLKRNSENPEFASNAILDKMGFEGKVLLDSVIADNKGKVLFVDLWATWCGPCIEEMKVSKEFMPRFEGKDIEFIFLCVNSTEENWKTTLSRMKIGGKHYFCNNSQSRDIRQALGVEGIPHYLIINKNGYIVESKSSNLARSLHKIDKLLAE